MAARTAAKVAKRAAPAPKGCSDRAYHVDRNKAQDRWEIVDDEGRVIGHRHDQGEAIELAIREAQHAHGAGDEAMVCVEQADGHYALAWSSR